MEGKVFLSSFFVSPFQGISFLQGKSRDIRATFVFELVSHVARCAISSPRQDQPTILLSGDDKHFIPNKTDGP